MTAGAEAKGGRLLCSPLMATIDKLGAAAALLSPCKLRTN